MLNKILIIGGSGFLGSFLFLSLAKQQRKVSATYSTKKIHHKLVKLDIRQKESIDEVLQKIKPDIIIHAGGLTNTDYCEMNKSEAYSINVTGTQNLLDLFSGKVIYMSTDYVFDGKIGNYNEDYPKSPLNHYGYTKSCAEDIVLQRRNNLVVRISGLYGFNPLHNKFINSYLKPEVVASMKLISTPTYINDLVDNIDRIIEMEGILHFAGNEAVSRFHFAKQVISELGLSTKLHTECSNVRSISERPQDSSITSIRQSFVKTPLKEGLKQLRCKYEKAIST